jgi:hypothetical protein
VLKIVGKRGSDFLKAHSQVPFSFSAFKPESVTFFWNSPFPTIDNDCVGVIECSTMFRLTIMPLLCEQPVKGAMLAK